MVAYSYKKRFVAAIRSGAKTHTIRNPRKRDVRIGEAMQHYCAMRTKHCFLIGRAVCRDVRPITIDREECRVEIDGEPAIEFRADLDDFAICDGFRDWDDMVEFWAAEDRPLRWVGIIIYWRDFTLPEGVTL